MRYTQGVRRVLALSLLTLSASLIHCGAARNSPTAAANNGSTATEGATGAAATARSLSPREIADRSTAAVVSVHNEESLGTGFVVRADGWIATNLHVIERGGDVAVTFT